MGGRTRPRRMLDRLPLRRRLMAGFLSATFVIFLAAGAFIYWRFDVALNRDLDMELIKSAKTLRPLVGADARIKDRALAAAPGVAWQVLDGQGAVLDSDGPATQEPMLSDKQFDRMRDSAHTFNVGAFLPVSDEPYRVRVVPIGDQRHLLVAARRDHRDDALRDLLAQLLLAGVGTLVVTAFVGDRLARAALRPVEVYRRQAEAITAGNAELRLDVPTEHDDEITRLGHTFNAMLASLDGALTRERRFVNEASHELRTPITLLSSRIQLARRRPRTTAEHEAILAELHVDVERLARLSEHLLERRQVRAPDDACDVVGEIERVVAARGFADHLDAVRLEVAVPAGSGRVAASGLDVERILTNLLDNATRHGAPPVLVGVDVPQSGWVRILVSDQGPGMRAPVLARATEPFARAASARSSPGSGLGLALVRSLVVERGGQLRLCHGGHHVRHGERLTLRCEHSEAMTITVLLPLAPNLDPNLDPYIDPPEPGPEYPGPDPQGSTDAT